MNEGRCRQSDVVVGILCIRCQGISVKNSKKIDTKNQIAINALNKQTN